MIAPSLCAAAAAIAASAAPAASGGALVVRFGGLAPQGQVQVAVFASEAAWRVHTKPVRSAVLKLAGGSSVEVRFDGLPAGAYGVMAYHDKNGNGRLDTLPVGLPVEPYGFSNNARGTFGPPSWGAARVVVEPGKTQQQTIRLK